MNGVEAASPAAAGGSGRGGGPGQTPVFSTSRIYLLCTSIMAMLCFMHLPEALRNIMFGASQSDTDSATHIKINDHSSLYGAPFIIVTEGGCSGTTAIGSYIRKIIAAHDLNRLHSVGFEFLNVGHHKRGTGGFKNPYFQDIIQELNMTNEEANNDIGLVLESIQRAQAVAKESNSLMFFKANVKQYARMSKIFNINLDGVSYAGFYRDNILDRCICMIKDCFHEARDYGNAVFADNGTVTDPCSINKRRHPEVDVQANFTNVIGCMEEDQGRVDFVRDQSFDSFSSESLFQFEDSMDGGIFEASVSEWMQFLKPLMKEVLDRTLVASVLQEERGSRLGPSSQSSKVYNYNQVKDEVNGIPMWEELLHF